MNLKDLHTDKEVSAKLISQQLKSNAIAIQISENGTLKEHITKDPAVLFCVLGRVEYEDEKGVKIELVPGDFHQIQPMIKHWVKALEQSQLLLLK